MAETNPLPTLLHMQPEIDRLLDKRLNSLINLHLNHNGFLKTLGEQQQAFLLTKLRGTFDLLKLDVGTLIEQALLQQKL